MCRSDVCQCLSIAVSASRETQKKASKAQSSTDIGDYSLLRSSIASIDRTTPSVLHTQGRMAIQRISNAVLPIRRLLGSFTHFDQTIARQKRGLQCQCFGLGTKSFIISSLDLIVSLFLHQPHLSFLSDLVFLWVCELLIVYLFTHCCSGFHCPLPRQRKSFNRSLPAPRPGCSHHLDGDDHIRIGHVRRSHEEPA